MSNKQSPWWLEAGPESCHFCEGRVHFEALAYCALCDRPLCLSCQVEFLEGHTILCPECVAESGGA